ncbi:hypothetical protein D3C87_1472160 [compost metagenome]
MHGRDHGRMLAHTEVVVGTPDGHILGAIRRVVRRSRETSTLSFEIGEHAVTAFLMQSVQFAFEKCLEIHAYAPKPASGLFLIFAIFFVNPKEAACACLRQ